MQRFKRPSLQRFKTEGLIHVQKVTVERSKGHNGKETQPKFKDHQRKELRFFTEGSHLKIKGHHGKESAQGSLRKGEGISTVAMERSLEEDPWQGVASQSSHGGRSKGPWFQA